MKEDDDDDDGGDDDDDNDDADKYLLMPDSYYATFFQPQDLFQDNRLPRPYQSHHLMHLYMGPTPTSNKDQHHNDSVNLPVAFCWRRLEVSKCYATVKCQAYLIQGW